MKYCISITGKEAYSKDMTETDKDICIAEESDDYEVITDMVRIYLKDKNCRNVAICISKSKED